MSMPEVTPTPPAVDIVIKRPTESLTSFYERGEKRGVMRECTHCGAKRRFSHVNCPICHRQSFKQIQGEPPADPIKGDPTRPTSKPRQQPPPPQSNDGFSFEPNPDYNEDPAAPAPEGMKQMEPEVTSHDAEKPLKEQTVPELRATASRLEVDLSEATKKDDILDRIENHLAGK